MNELSSQSVQAVPFILGPSPRVLFVHHQNKGCLILAQETISAMFRQPRIDFVQNMAAALESVDKERYDLIFIEEDLGNNESGTMVARALQTKNVAVPIVGFYVNLSEELRQTSIRAGMADVVMPDKLETFLRQHVVQMNNAAPRQLVLNDKPRILIIDDRPQDFKIVVARNVIEMLFPEAGFEIVETGEEALKVLQTNPRDVVFIDFNLAERVNGGRKEKVYGDMVARELRLAGIGTYFVGFSSDMSDFAKRQRCFDAGMDDAISPNELSQFLQAHKHDPRIG